MKVWQHSETGRTCERKDSDGSPGERWHEITYRCEHGFAGCLMPGDHLSEECHSAEMLEAQWSAAAGVKVSETNDSSDLLCGIRAAVEELREIRAMYEREKTAENKAHIRFAEMSVLQMAESLVDKTA